MNASRLTVVIAEGIHLYAQMMDHPPASCPTEVKEAWERWHTDNPSLVSFVQKEQYDLFDRVNARF